MKDVLINNTGLFVGDPTRQSCQLAVGLDLGALQEHGLDFSTDFVSFWMQRIAKIKASTFSSTTKVKD